MSPDQPKARGSVRILKVRVELLCEVHIDDLGPQVKDEGERFRVLSVALLKSGTGTNPKDNMSEADIGLVMMNARAMEEMACLSLIERNHRERNPLVKPVPVIPGKA